MVMFVCTFCNGQGFHSNGNMCRDCGGTGRLEYHGSGTPQAPGDAMGCPVCYGQGLHSNGNVCMDCCGTGRIKYK